MYKSTQDTGAASLILHSTCYTSSPWKGQKYTPTKEELSSKHSPDGPTHDVVFGETTEDGPNYRNLRIPSQNNQGGQSSDLTIR